MKLSANLISGRKFYKAGEEVPPGEVPEHLKAFAAAECSAESTREIGKAPPQSPHSRVSLRAKRHEKAV